MLDQATRRLHDILENGTHFVCEGCETIFDELEQNSSQQKFGECPYCGCDRLKIFTPEGDEWVYGDLE